MKIQIRPFAFVENRPPRRPPTREASERGRYQGTRAALRSNFQLVSGSVNSENRPRNSRNSQTTETLADDPETLADGQIQLAGSGMPNASYDVQANTNLSTTNWLWISTIQADANGLLTVTDTNAANFPQRFYRFKSK